MLRDTIFTDMRQAMKLRDQDSLDVLRYLWSEIKNAEIDAKHELTDEAVTLLFQKEVKRRTQAMEQFEAAGRIDLGEREREQLEIISRYLPQPLTQEELETILSEVIETVGSDDFSKIMKSMMIRVGAQAEGDRVARLVRERLSK